ncbi:hypothetical protein CVT24_006659 [Panaeolus cyanescens]|uniref:BAH domain-containing protein n=1 Tax=Panaeolus cyanescens TaxID=181874 RepID=A0A409YSF0_9AGAR|nr:hypothetical protein CVT24_006659 [Panaeolus cyanescens]
MPRKSLRSSKQKANPVDDGGSRMTEKKFLTFSPFSTFLVQDDDNVNHKFQKNNICAILPSDRSPEESLELWQYWIGQVVEIRAEEHEDGTNTVWVKVKWFYNAQDTSSALKSFDASVIDPWERLESDMHDYVESLAFEDVVNLKTFDERDPFQSFIPRETFFSRYQLGYKSRQLKPKPSTTGCSCGQPYNPNDMDASMVMHFCPRPSCRRAFHQRCLVNAKSKESLNRTVTVIDPIKADTKAQASRKPRQSTSKQASLKQVGPTLSPRSLRLLACSPDTDEVVDLASLIPLTIVTQTAEDASDSSRPRKRARTSKQSSATQEALLEQPRSLVDVLGDMPGDLIRIAEQPLVRGGAFVHGGITGNICFVSRARQLVYSILEGEALPDDWESVIFQEEGTSIDNAIVTLKGATRSIPPVVCPNCQSAI